MVRSKLIAAAFVPLVLATGVGEAANNNAEVVQGEVARWSGQTAAECGIFGRRYAAIAGDCYYPVDMKARPGVHEIAMWNSTGARTLGTLTVVARQCALTDITLDDDRYVNISDANKARSVEERERIVKAVSGTDARPAFLLPLGAPSQGMVARDPSDFCELRRYNGGQLKSRHTGLDYPLAQGTPVVAGADGTVTLSEEQFYTGHTVIVDHGGGLVTMFFHLDEVAVETGAVVKRGDPLGTVGSTGRSTGPHLHFGARYQNQRIDAGTLLGDLSSLPGVGEERVDVAESASADGAAAVDADASLPGQKEDPAADVSTSPASQASTPDEAVDEAQPDIQAGDPEAADAAEKPEDALEAEAEAQREADQEAKSR